MTEYYKGFPIPLTNKPLPAIMHIDGNDTISKVVRGCVSLLPEVRLTYYLEALLKEILVMKENNSEGEPADTTALYSRVTEIMAIADAQETQ